MSALCPYATFRTTERPSELVPLGARSVGHHTVPAGWIDNSFKVAHAVFFWGVRGTGVMEFDDRNLQVEPDCIGVLFPGQTQRIRSLEVEWEYCWWTMDGPQVVDLISGFGFKPGIYRGGPAPTVLVGELKAVIERPGRRHELEASAIVYEMVCHAARYTRPMSKRQIEDPLVNAAVDVILRSWHDGFFGVDALADTLETHRSSLSRRFKKATGSTLLDYINSLRMHHAAHLLRHTGLTINEIARQCGFADPNYFAKKFRARFGKSPSALRGTSHAD